MRYSIPSSCEAQGFNLTKLNLNHRSVLILFPCGCCPPSTLSLFTPPSLSPPPPLLVAELLALLLPPPLAVAPAPLRSLLTLPAGACWLPATEAASFSGLEYRDVQDNPTKEAGMQFMSNVWLLECQRPCLGPSTAGGAVGTLIGNCLVNWSSSKSTFKEWSGIGRSVNSLTHPSPLEEWAWFLLLFLLLFLLSHLSVSISRVNWSDYRSRNFYLFLLFSKVPPIASTWMVPVSTFYNAMWEFFVGI